MHVNFVSKTNQMPGHVFVQTHVKTREICIEIAIDSMHKIALFFRIWNKVKNHMSLRAHVLDSVAICVCAPLSLCACVRTCICVSECLPTNVYAFITRGSAHACVLVYNVKFHVFSSR